MTPAKTTTMPQSLSTPGLRLRRLFLFVSLVIVSFASAQEESKTTDKVVTMDKFMVTADIDSYYQATSSMASKIPMDLKSLSSSLTIMNSTAITDRNAVVLTDVFNYVVGATQSQGNINGFSFRGFPNTGAYTQNIQFDGLMGATLKKAATGAANVDSLEFLKGPNSVLYGQMNPGGLLNIVTKKPKETRETSVRVTAGTYVGEFDNPGDTITKTISLDTTGPVGNSKSMFYRVVVDTGSSPTSRPGFDNSFSIYPSFTYKWSADTALTIKGEVSKDYRQQDDGVIPIFTNGTAFGEAATYYTAPLNTIYQDSKDRGLDYGEAIAAFFNTTLGADWNLRIQSRSVWHVDHVREFTVNNANVFNPKSSYAVPTSTLRRQYNNVINGHRYNYADANVYRLFQTGNIKHTVLLGVGGGWEAFLNKRVSFGPNQTVAQAVTLINPILDQVADYPADGTGATDVATDWVSLGEYVSDQMQIGDRIHVAVGLRHDSIKIEGGNKLNLLKTQFTKDYSTVTKQLGVVYDFTPSVSAYASWSESLKPGANLAFDSTGNSTFPPEAGEQYETGVKFGSADKTINATFAVYQITRSNVIVPSGTNFTVATGSALPGQAISRLDGEQQSKGVEFEVQWQPIPNWQLQTGWAYSEATITQSDKNPASVGYDLANAPRLSGNVWSRYNIPTGKLKGLGFGGGVVYVGKAWAGDPTTKVYYRLKEWTRVDTSVYYTWQRYNFALNIQNLLDTRYIQSAQSALTLNVGEQRKLTFSVGTKF